MPEPTATGIGSGGFGHYISLFSRGVYVEWQIVFARFFVEGLYMHRFRLSCKNDVL